MAAAAMTGTDYVSIHCGLSGVLGYRVPVPVVARVGRVFAVTREYRHAGPGRVPYVLTHVKTGFAIGDWVFRTKRDAIRYGKALLKLVPEAKWDCTDAKLLRRRMPKGFTPTLNKLARKCGGVRS